jgi:hypothetical protein
MNSNFWLLQPPANQPRAEDAPGTKYATIICPAHDGHKRAGNRLADISVLVHPSGAKDFTWTWYSEVLMSERVVDIFEKNHVTGFETRPAKVAYPSQIKARPPHFFELVVTGWGGLAAPAAGLSLVKSCPACGHKRYIIAEPSRTIDAGAWDGSDLFIVWPLPRYPFASDRLASIIRQEKISGVKLIPAPQIPVERGGGLTPGPLAHFMPEKRARELGKRFGIS